MPLGAQELLTVAPRLAADALAACGEAQVRVAGGSMFPVVRPGDVIHVRACPASDLQSRDIVLVLDGDRLIAHRLVRRTADRVVLRGDAHWHDDAARPQASVLGRVVAITRGRATRTAPFACSVFDRVRGLMASEWTRWSRSAKAVALRNSAAVRSERRQLEREGFSRAINARPPRERAIPAPRGGR